MIFRDVVNVASTTIATLARADAWRAWVRATLDLVADATTTMVYLNDEDGPAAWTWEDAQTVGARRFDRSGAVEIRVGDDAAVEAEPWTAARPVPPRAVLRDPRQRRLARDMAMVDAAASVARIANRAWLVLGFTVGDAPDASVDPVLARGLELGANVWVLPFCFRGGSRGPLAAPGDGPRPPLPPDLVRAIVEENPDG